jgi:hypothetical protein
VLVLKITVNFCKIIREISYKYDKLVIILCLQIGEMPPNPRLGALDMEIDRPGAATGEGLRYQEREGDRTLNCPLLFVDH